MKIINYTPHTLVHPGIGNLQFMSNEIQNIIYLKNIITLTEILNTYFNYIFGTAITIIGDSPQSLFFIEKLSYF